MSTGTEQTTQLTDKEILKAIRTLMAGGKLQHSLRVKAQNDPLLVEALDELEDLQQLTLALASGNLDFTIRAKGMLGEALIAIQTKMRQLIVQVQELNTSTLKQQVLSMEEFPGAYDGMVQNLSRSVKALQNRHMEGTPENSTDPLTMAARHETEEAYHKLQVQMVEIASLQARLRDEALRDPLTGCFNRRYLDETIRREFSRSQREGYPISLVMVDLDNFKNVNDEFGHQAGDAVLQSLGILLRGHTRLGDIVCRYGGDEFLIVLPNMTQENAMMRASSWKHALGQSEIFFGEKRLSPTLSMGIASSPQHGRTEDQVILAADQALYTAKRNGRDCIIG